MAGYADALASVLYPNTAANSAYTLFGQGVRGISLPTFEKPWQNAIAQGLQGLLGAGLQTYGAHSAAQANAENAAKMVPYLQRLGVGVSPEIQSGLTSSDPGMQRLALALTETQMNQAGNAAATKAEIDKFRQQKAIEFENAKALKQMEIDQLAQKQKNDADNKRFDDKLTLSDKLNALPETKAFKEASTAFEALEKAGGKDTKAASLFFKKTFERAQNPDSVVSPGEMEALNDLQGFYDKWQGKINSLRGLSDLTPEVRGQMIELVRNYRNAVGAQYERSAQTYMDLARERGIDPTDILTTPFLSEKQKDPVGWAKKQIAGSNAAVDRFPRGINVTDDATSKGDRFPGSQTAGELTAEPPTEQGEFPPLPPGKEYRIGIGPNGERIIGIINIGR